MVELWPRPPIRGLLRLGVPVKQLGHLVAEVAHAALPARAALDERDVGVDVRPATAAARDDRVGDDGNLVLCEQASFLVQLRQHGPLTSPSLRLRYGVITSASGSLLLLSSAAFVGIALTVQRWYE